MQPFEFVSGDAPATLIDHHRQPTAQYLAGGTTLVDLMKLHVMTPSRVIDLTAMPSRAITDQGASVRVDALVSNSDMALHPLISGNFPLVSEAILSGASVQIRNLATTAGNILQRTRCSFFRDPTARCNKRVPGSGCDAMQGFSRDHAILGVSDHCIASHPSDLCVALMAVEATVSTQGPGGNRDIPFASLYTLPGDSPQIENVLVDGELILSVSLPKQEWFKRSVYVKIRDRSSYAFALASAAVALDLDGGEVRQVRIAMGGIGTIPWRARAAEDRLRGGPMTIENLRAAAKTVTADARTTSHNAYKVALAEQTLIRALREAGKKP